MPCDTYIAPKQTVSQRAAEIRETIARLSLGLGNGQIKVKVGPQGAIAFLGFNDRRGVTDGCAYRRIMATGSTAAKMAIAKAEQLAGRSVDKMVVASGVHLHGTTWHGGHK